MLTIQHLQVILLYLQLARLAKGIGTEASKTSTITATPNLRSIGSEVIGSTTVPAYSSWTTWSCSLGSTWTELAPYAECRTTAFFETPMWTGCLSTSLLVGPFDTQACSGSGQQTACVTGLIYKDNNVTLTNYACWPSWTQGNWEAWRQTKPSHSSLSTILPIAIVVPIVVLSIAGGLLWFRIRRKHLRRKQLELIGQSRAMSVVSSSRPMTVADDVELPGPPVKHAKEMEEQRRASELTAVIEPRRSRVPEDVADDVSSYHTTNSQVFRAELTGSSYQQGDGNADGHDRSRLQRMLQRFRF